MEANNKLVVKELGAGGGARKDEDVQSVGSNVTALSAMPSEAAEMEAQRSGGARSSSGGGEEGVAASVGVAGDTPAAGSGGADGDESEEEDDLL